MIRSINGSSLRAAGVVVLALFLAKPASAQGTDTRALAQALFVEGRALLAKDQTAEACAKFEESVRLHVSSGALLNLGLCHEKLGKLASASVELSESVARAVKENQPDRERIAREHLAAVEPRVAHLSVVVPAASAIDGLEVRRDGIVLGKPAWGVAAGVDPGPHTVDAAAPGREPFRAVVEVKADAESIRVEIPLLARTTKGEAPPLTAAPTVPHAASPEPTSEIGNTQRRLSLVVGAAGLVGTGIGIFFALDASSRWTDAEARCPNRTCRDRADQELGAKAGRSADFATAFVVVGGGAIAAGALLFLLAPRSGATSVRVAPTVGSAMGGLTLSGTL